mmetsp:Transcript_2441/g.3461  ORF Transcript_2441/g.3461 Transcript_2441/m.3461 type:complete len:723 (+) Transcript_2441:114-2282(+)
MAKKGFKGRLSATRGFNALNNIAKGTFKEDADHNESDYTFDEKKILAVRQLLGYLVYLSIFLMIIFFPGDATQSYLMQDSIRKELLGTELSRDVFFEDLTTPSEWYQFMREIYIPTLYYRSFYNGEKYPKNTAADYQPYFINDVNMVMGITRIRQVRMPTESTCSVTTILQDEFELCNAQYSISDQDEEKWTFGNMTLSFKTGASMDDGEPWESPITLTWYSSGGYVVDLPNSRHRALDTIEKLESNGFIDVNTRAVFVDFTAYNPNNDHVFYGRLVMETMATGKVQPVAQLDAGPVNRDNRALTFQNGSSKMALAALFLEFVLYIFTAYFISQWVNDICDYHSFMEYLCVPWNLMDMGIVFCFAAILSFRATYMIRMATFQYDVADDLSEDEWDYNDFVPALRISVLMYRLARNFFAMCVLLAFLKAFKYLGVSKRLAQFTDTVFFAYKTMVILSIILGVICSGYAIAFHMAFGHSVQHYSSFTESLLALLLSILGDFDLQELRLVNPVLGVILFLSYVLIILFVTLSMLLKIVDDTYQNVVEEFLSGSKENLGKDIKYAIYSVLHDIYWWAVLKKTLFDAKRLRHKADTAKDKGTAGKYKGGVTEDQANLEAAALEKEHEVVELKAEMDREKAHRKEVMDHSNYRKKAATIHTIAQMSEDDITLAAVEDRLHLLQHRQAIMLKMATRLARSVEFRIGQQHGLEMRMEKDVDDQDLPRPSN